MYLDYQVSLPRLRLAFKGSSTAQIIIGYFYYLHYFSNVIMAHTIRRQVLLNTWYKNIFILVKMVLIGPQKVVTPHSLLINYKLQGSRTITNPSCAVPYIIIISKLRRIDQKCQRRAVVAIVKCNCEKLTKPETTSATIISFKFRICIIPLLYQCSVRKL